MASNAGKQWTNAVRTHGFAISKSKSQWFYEFAAFNIVRI